MLVFDGSSSGSAPGLCIQKRPISEVVLKEFGSAHAGRAGPPLCRRDRASSPAAEAAKIVLHPPPHV
jgi:hypothetical protein